MSEFGTGKANEETDRSTSPYRSKGDDPMDWSSCESSYDYDDAFSSTIFETSVAQSPPLPAFSPNFSSEVEDPAQMFCPSIFSPSKLTFESPVISERRETRRQLISKSLGFYSTQSSRLTPCMSNLQIISTRNFLSQEDKPYDFNESITTTSSTFIGKRNNMNDMALAAFDDHSASLLWNEHQTPHLEYVKDDNEEDRNVLGSYASTGSGDTLPYLISKSDESSVENNPNLHTIMQSGMGDVTGNFTRINTATTGTFAGKLWSNEITPVNRLHNTPYQYFPPNTEINVNSKLPDENNNNSNNNDDNNYSDSNSNSNDNSINSNDDNNKNRDSLERLSEARSRTLSFELKAFTFPLGTLKGIETDDFSEMMAPLPTQCNCKKSQCLKLYCDCFALMQLCSDKCRCSECRNDLLNEDIRQAAIQITIQRTPTAFKNKVTPHTAHVAGCHCSKSNCLKKYCECYLAGAVCGGNCRCQSCKNFQGSEDLRNARRINKVNTVSNQSTYSNTFSKTISMTISTRQDDTKSSNSVGLIVSPTFASETEARRRGLGASQNGREVAATAHVDVMEKVEIGGFEAKKKIRDFDSIDDNMWDEWSNTNIRYPRARMMIGQRRGYNYEPGLDSRLGSATTTVQSTNQVNNHWNDRYSRKKNKNHSFHGLNNVRKSNISATTNHQYGYSSYENFISQVNNQIHTTQVKMKGIDASIGLAPSHEDENGNKDDDKNDISHLTKDSNDINKNDNDNDNNNTNNNIFNDNNNIGYNNNILKQDWRDASLYPTESVNKILPKNSSDSINNDKWILNGNKNENYEHQSTGIKRGSKDNINSEDLHLKLKVPVLKQRVVIEDGIPSLSVTNNDNSICTTEHSFTPEEYSFSSFHPISFTSSCPGKLISNYSDRNSTILMNNNSYNHIPSNSNPHLDLSTVSSDSNEYNDKNIINYNGMGLPYTYTYNQSLFTSTQSVHKNFPSRIGTGTGTGTGTKTELPSHHTKFINPIYGHSHPYVSSDFKSIYDDRTYVQHTGSPKNNKRKSIICESDSEIGSMNSHRNDKKYRINKIGILNNLPSSYIGFYETKIILSNVSKFLNPDDQILLRRITDSGLKKCEDKI